MKTNSNYTAATNENLDTYLTTLVQEKFKLADESKYIEAENLKRKIVEVKQKIDISNKRALDEQHETEIIALEENYKKEIEEHESNWNKKIDEFRDVEKNEVEALILNQNKEIESMQDLIQQTFKTKPSKEILELKVVEILMRKQERYLEANFIKNRIDFLGKKEEEKSFEEKEKLFKQKLQNLFRKHQNEKNYISEKFVIDYLVMKKTKEQEMHHIFCRYKNMQLNLEAQQKQEKFLSENVNIMKAKSLSRLNVKPSFSVSRSKYFSHTTQDFSKEKNNYNSSPFIEHITEETA